MSSIDIPDELWARYNELKAQLSATQPDPPGSGTPRQWAEIARIETERTRVCNELSTALWGQHQLLGQLALDAAHLYRTDARASRRFAEGR